MIKNLKNIIFNKKNENENIESDPISIVPINNIKQIKNTNEIYLGYRNITKIINFNKFYYIEVLWLNNNKITKLEGLKKNFRLKELYLHNNLINNLSEDLNYIKNLRLFSIYNNNISNLDENILNLKKLIYLDELLINNNPVMEEPNARNKIIFNLKTLKNLNRLNINQEEKQKCENIMKRKKLNKIEKKKFLKNYEIISETEKLLIKTYKDIKNNISHKQSVTSKLKEVKLTGGLLDYNIIVKKYELEPCEKLKFLPYFKSKATNDLKLPISNLNDFYLKFINDEFDLVKIPEITEEKFINLSIKYQKEEKISWLLFKKYLNEFKWNNIMRDDIKEKINKLYNESQLLFNQNKKEESFKILEKAMILDTKSK